MSSQKVLFESARFFKVWQYTVSHRRLLLRSSRERPPNTRIDLHFGAVSFVLLYPFYDGLRIRHPDSEELEMVAQLSGDVPSGAHVYLIEGSRPSFIISGRMQWHEDEGGTSDPSWFGHMLGTP
ncbi:hypothetical protein [Actinomadura violacea]|uniref:Uncharacterized protein n=1 Tax=Actinomadura violacea TaxID=2819934 RepID=A0ABS3RUY5_9ACTN|nr:hypothetical protein [Actinomadura violacea]MBO2460308.1 hypothetical protein [Actinomadura violacea]